MNRIHYQACPVCSSSRVSYIFHVKDHTASGEIFPVWECGTCSLRFTQDVPDESSISGYYHSPDYISHTDTAGDAVSRIYRVVRRFTLRQKAQLVIRHTKKKGNLLDIGAGTGAFLDTMKKMQWQVHGVEPVALARENAARIYGIELMDSLGPELAGESFDAITLWHVLEHVHDLHGYLRRLKHLLAQKGRIFIAVPNYISYDAQHFGNDWAAYDVPRHLYHFSPASMETLCRLHGLTITDRRRMWFDSFYVSLLSSAHRNKASWLKAGITALRSNIRALADRNRCSSLIYVIRKD